MGLTEIEWCYTPGPDGKLHQGYSFNAWWGCTNAGAECDHCYAETFSKRIGLDVWGADKPRRFFGDAYWAQPQRWNERAKELGVRLKVFVNDMSDLFERYEGPDADRLVTERQRLFRLIDELSDLDFLLLTKRAGNVPAMVPAHWQAAFPRNVWIGTTIGTRARVAELRRLREIPAVVRFVSFEPLLEDLGPLDLTGIHWGIIGGESGGSARRFELRWARSILRQCRAQGVAVFLKQLGARASDPVNGIAGRFLRVPEEAARLVSLRLKHPKGGDMTEWPEDLRVREWPEVTRG